MNPANNSALCLGLDPDPELMPKHLADMGAAGVQTFCLKIINATKDTVGAYKLNTAFFEWMRGPGMEAMRNVIGAAKAAGVPVILDAKRSDIGNTARFYAKMAYDTYRADAMTVVPYFGLDALEPFDWPDKTAFVVAASTNDRPELMQTNYVELVQACVKRFPTMGFVAPAPKHATDKRLAMVRGFAPDSWLLIPGVGAQGGNLEQTASDAQLHKGKTLIAVSRSILYAGSGSDYSHQAGKAAKDYHERLTQAARGH